jgi:hypothetical protein
MEGEFGLTLAQARVGQQSVDNNRFPRSRPPVLRRERAQHDGGCGILGQRAEGDPSQVHLGVVCLGQPQGQSRDGPVQSRHVHRHRIAVHLSVRNDAESLLLETLLAVQEDLPNRTRSRGQFHL